MACDPFSLCPRFDSVLPLVFYTKFSVTILVGIWSTMNIGMTKTIRECRRPQRDGSNSNGYGLVYVDRGVISDARSSSGLQAGDGDNRRGFGSGCSVRRGRRIG